MYHGISFLVLKSISVFIQGLIGSRCYVKVVNSAPDIGDKHNKIHSWLFGRMRTAVRFAIDPVHVIISSGKDEVVARILRPKY